MHDTQLGIVAEVKMNLCIDVGNTTIGVGFFKEKELFLRLTFTVNQKQTKDEFKSVIKRTLEENKLSNSDVSKIIFSSVVPSLNSPFIGALEEVFHIKPLLIAPGIKTGLSVHVDNPSEIGNDLIGVMVGAKEKYGYPLLIADLGTASKILLIDKSGSFISCLIMPGLSLSLSSLTTRAALLPEIMIKVPETILAKNTIDAINAGVIFGHADMINGAINRYEKEIGYKCKHILSGGSSAYLKDILKEDFEYDPDLCLKGLNSIIYRNEEK